MEREQFLNIINEINAAKLSSLHHLDEIESLSGAERVAKGLNPDKHRWYETTTDVYRVGGWFLGVNGPSQMYSESSSWDDLYHEVVACEMESVQSVTYLEKQ